MKNNTHIYLDHAATTPLLPESCDAMMPYLKEEYGNPSSLHTLGDNAKQAIKEAKESIKNLLNTHKNDEVLFTSGGTESCNLAIIGYCLKNKNKANHIITSDTEHKAVLESFTYLETQGFEVTYLKSNEYGQIEIETFKKALRPNTLFASIIYAQSVFGTINPISDIGHICRKNNICFHTDACQAINYLDINIQNLKVDMMTINASKIYGPKGIGLLYIKKGIRISPLFHGGGQQKNLRSGTENVAGIVGFKTSLEVIRNNYEEETKRLEVLRNYCFKILEKTFTHIQIQGHRTERLPNNIYFSLPGIEAESVLFHLSQKDIYIGTGSACNSNIDNGRSDTFRITLGRETTQEDIDIFLEAFQKVIDFLVKRNL